MLDQLKDPTKLGSSSKLNCTGVYEFSAGDSFVAYCDDGGHEFAERLDTHYRKTIV